MGLFKLLRTKGRLKSRKFISVIYVLQRMLGKQRFEELLIYCPDRRHLMERAAEQLGISQDELLVRVAKKTKLKCLARVPAMDLSLMPNNLSISDFRRVGAIGLCNESGMVAIACVDPAMVRHLAGSDINMPVYLCTWEKIAKALDESEQLYVSRKAEIEAEQKAKMSKAARAVLLAIIKEVERFSGPSNVDIIFEENACSYKFLSADSKEARGDINVLIKEALYELLSEIAKGESKDSCLSTTNNNYYLEPKILEYLRRVRLSWKSDLEQRQEQSSVFNSVVPFPANASAEVVEKNGGCNGVKQDASTKMGGKPLVLLVDDNTTFATVLARFFQRYQMETKIVDSAQQAWFALKEEKLQPDLVVCDVHMPAMNGFELLRRIRADRDLMDLSIIMLTSDEDVETELKLLSDGADVYLKKSEDPRVLCVQAQRLVEKQLRNRAA